MNQVVEFDLDEDFDDYPSDYEGFEAEEDEHLDLDVASNLQFCVWPTLQDTLYNFLIPLLLINLALKVILLVNDAFDRGKKLREHCIIITGSVGILLYYFREQIWEASVGIVCVILAFLFCFVYHRRNNHFWWITCLFALILNESLIFAYQKSFQRFRPLLMLIFMKQITIRQTLNQFSNFTIDCFFETLCYLFHPQCLPLGGWNPFVEDKQQKNKSNKINTIGNFFSLYLWPLVKALAFLIGSNCVIHVAMLLIEANVLPHLYRLIGEHLFALVKGFLNAYFVALQFRFSHYFICFTTQSLHAIWDFRTLITNPIEIEFPRSLLQVVNVWNISFHSWLKTNIYLPLSKSTGDTVARIVTFALSAMLHGFNAQIWTVLLTLAPLTWVESRLRSKLATKYSACVRSFNCRLHFKDKPLANSYRLWLSSWFGIRTIEQPVECQSGHLNNEFNSFFVNFVNFMFSLLAIVHLAFLGSAFDGNESHSTFAHVYEIWSYLHFYSHTLLVITFVAYKLI